MVVTQQQEMLVQLEEVEQELLVRTHKLHQIILEALVVQV